MLLASPALLAEVQMKETQVDMARSEDASIDGDAIKAVFDSHEEGIQNCYLYETIIIKSRKKAASVKPAKGKKGAKNAKNKKPAKTEPEEKVITKTKPRKTKKQGTVTMLIKTEASGKIIFAQTQSTTLGDKSIEDCLSDYLKNKVTLPATAQGFELEYPFVFRKFSLWKSPFGFLVF